MDYKKSRNVTEWLAFVLLLCMSKSTAMGIKYEYFLLQDAKVYRSMGNEQ